ncbi:hypothetical protein BH23GEM4_BH23GEM4_13030 [soil metagenome]|jgi:DNA-directed RNA polymerase omega subunit
MKVVTPGQVAHHTGSKYLGVLVAAKHARDLNELRRNQLFFEAPPELDEVQEKLTTTALEKVADGELEYKLVRRSQVDL